MTPEEIAELRTKRYNATVTLLQKPNPELMIFRVRPDFAIPLHLSGQYTSLGLGKWEPRFPGSQEEDLSPADESKLVRRAYSISCPIIENGNLIEDYGRIDLEFYVVLVKQGGAGERPPSLTPRLFMLREGE